MIPKAFPQAPGPQADRPDRAGVMRRSGLKLGLCAAAVAIAGCAQIGTPPSPAEATAGPAGPGPSPAQVAEPVPSASGTTRTDPAAAPGTPGQGAASAQELMTARAPRAPASGWPAVPVPALGINIVASRVTADGFAIDIRYQVTDPQKATPMLDRKIHPVLIRQGSGERYYVPSSPKLGPVRQTVRNGRAPEIGRTYFMVFANPERRLKAGDLVALEIGAVRAESLVLQ